MTFLQQTVTLVGVETQKGKHADLFQDVVPVTRCLELLGQQIKQALTHGDDATCHLLDIGLPLLEERRIGKDHLDHTRAESGRVRDLGSLNRGELREDGSALCRSGGHNVERADTFAVQAGVLGEALANEQGNALARNKVSYRPGIPVQVTRGETLVSAVEKGKVTLLDKDIGDLLPLLLGRINTGRVVSAGM